MFRKIKNFVVRIDACKKAYKLSMIEYVKWFESLDFEKQKIVLSQVKYGIIDNAFADMRFYIQATYGIEGWIWVHKRISEIIVETVFGKDFWTNEALG